MKKDVLICGVGGQGTVLASKLIAAAAMEEGNTVHSAETIGMAQKGGSVFSHLRVGEGVRSPMIRRGTADLLLAFEPAEAVRMLPYLKKGGTVVVNSHPIMPVTAALKGTDYNGTEMVEYLREHTEHVLVIDGQKAAAVIGNPKTLNVIMLGAALESGALDFLTEEDVLQAIRQKVKPAYVALNEKALRYAFSLAAE